MKKLIPILLCALLVGCGTQKHVVIETQTVTNYIDSIAWHDSTIFTVVPVEVYKDYTGMLDTLNLETSTAKAQAFLDTTDKVLKGTIENKNTPIPTKIKWKEKIVYRDSVVTKEVPVEVVKEVTHIPGSYWWFLGFSILCVIYFGVRIYFKLKK